MKNKRSIQLLVILVFVMPLLVYAAMNWYNSEVNQLPVIGPPRGNGKALKDHVISDFRLINEDYSGYFEHEYFLATHS